MVVVLKDSLVTQSVLVASLFLAMGTAHAEDAPLAIGSQLELMVDGYLIESLDGEARQVLHHPVLQDIAIDFDAPWEGSGSAYPTVFRDGDSYRMYYRGAQFSIVDGRLQSGHPAVTCYAESRDGIQWNKPKLGLYEFNGSKENNIVWNSGPATHNFVPFKDSRPNIPDDQRYKALALADGGGLAAFASADGLRWRLLAGKPVLTDGAFDSQNLAFWDAQRGEYRAYYRDFRDGLRDIKTATSKDFLTWSEGEFLNYPDAPREQLYTNQVLPYYRAPQLLIGLPTRYLDRSWPAELLNALPEAEHRRLRSEVEGRFGSALTDTVLMTSRDGQTFQRWNETFLSPGPERLGTWNYGHLYTAWGMVETAPRIEGMPNELSIYATEGSWTGTAAQLRRYTLRIDGFASVSAAMPGGELRTKVLTFTGQELALNMATSIAGSVQVEIQDVDGKPIEGFTLKDCPPIFGNSIERIVHWNGKSDVSTLTGKPVRLRIILKDADLYSLRFRSE